MNDDSDDDFKGFLEEYGSPPEHTIGCAIAPPSTTCAIGDPAEHAQDASGEMEPFGYYYIDCGPPDPELVNRIKIAFDGGEQIIEGPTTHVFRPRICEEFMQSGVQEPIKHIIQRWLDQAKYFVQGPVIVGHNPHPTDIGPKLAHPVSDAISLFRVVEGTIDPGQRAFSIYPMTHHQSPTEFQAHSVSGGQRLMNSATLLIIRGGVLIDIIPPKDSLLVWIGYSKKAMLDDRTKTGIFPFMANYEYEELDSGSNYKRKGG